MKTERTRVKRRPDRGHYDKETLYAILDKEFICQIAFVFNGDPDSIFANHALNLSGVFNDARQKINSLTVALKQG